LTKQYRDLENAGYIYLEQLEEDPPKHAPSIVRHNASNGDNLSLLVEDRMQFKVVIPPVLLYALLFSTIQIFKPSERQFVTNLKDGKCSRKLLESLYLDHEAMKASLIYETKPGGLITIGEFYSGAIVGANVRDVILKFTKSDHAILIASNRYPLKVTKIDLTKEIDQHHNMLQLANGRGAPDLKKRIFCTLLCNRCCSGRTC
jgi:hypothetical protein